MQARNTNGKDIVLKMLRVEKGETFAIMSEPKKIFKFINFNSKAL